MDTTNRQVTRDGRHLHLTRIEFALLELFLARPGHVLTREWLLKSLWGEQGGPTSNTVDVYVMYLRRKLEAGGYFLSVPGAGMWVPCSLSLSVGTAGL